ncbi:DUF3309 family protein [Nitriliruptoraceae bacterium ZYF776]|nr:DUF3309 family protein [Profundirhabdus halotolerans]
MQTLVPIVVVSLLVILAAPVWRWSRGWGWQPAGILAVGLATLLLFVYSVVPD